MNISNLRSFLGRGVCRRVAAALMATLLLQAVAPLASRAQAPAGAHQSVVVPLTRNGDLAFDLMGDQVAAATVHMEGIAIPVPPDICAKLSHVQMPSVHLIFEPGVTSVRANDRFQVSLRLGPDSRRSAGELPEVELTFHHAEFQGAAIVTRTEGGWRTSEL